MVLTCERNETFGETDKPDAERSLVDNRSDGVGRFQLIAANPESRHEQWELLGKCRFLELEAIVELLGSDFEHIVEECEEFGNTLFLVGDVHALDGEAHDINRGERQVAASHRSAWSESVFKHTGAASHSSYLVEIAFRVVGTPILVLVESGIEIEEIGEEPASRNLARESV